jgi:tetratricopeptide (TPR) repeat protein
MSSIDEAEEALQATPPRTGLDRLDTIATGAVWLLAAGLLGLTAYFGYSVWSTRQQAILASPALRNVQGLEAQVRQKPNDVYTRVRYAEALGMAGMSDQAIAQLKEALKMDPKYVGAYQDLALIAGIQKDYPAAESYLKKVLELTATGDYQDVNARREVSFYYLGEIALMQQKFDDALGYFKAALRIRRDASDTYLGMAKAYVGNGDIDAAIKQLQIALTYDPKFAEANYEIGRLFLEKGDKVKAAYHLRVALDGNPKAEPPAEALASLGSLETWMTQAKNAFARKDYKTALNDAKIARSIDPTSVDAIRLYASIAEAKGDKTDAITAYKDILRVKPGDPDATSAVKRLGG